jgi:hypothetical protein
VASNREFDMGAVKRPALTRGVMALQVGCLLIGLAASLIPLLPKTHPFWGCTRFSTDEINISYVQWGSPASEAGLRYGDNVLSIDGQNIDGQNINNWRMWDQMAERIQPGQQVRLRVKRNGEEVTLTAKGLEPQLAAVVYYDWQLAFAGSCFVFLILIIATQSLPTLFALWRPILLIQAGLAGAATMLLYNWRFDTVLLNQRWLVDNLPFPWVQFCVCVAVAVGTAVLGTWDLRRTVSYSQRHVETEEKPIGSDLVKSIHVTERPRD